MAYPDLEDLKVYLREPVEADRNDTTLQGALDAAVTKVEAFTDRYFGTEATATAATFERTTTTTAIIRDFWTVADLVVAADGDTLTLDTDYEAGPHGQRSGYPFYTLEALGGSLPARMTVTAKWGWAECPDDVTTTVLELAALIWKRRDAPFGVMGFDDMGPQRVSDSDRKVLHRVGYLRRFPVLVG